MTVQQISADRWEFGSEFHWPEVAEQPVGSVLPTRSVLFASGRDALRALIRMGVAERGWRRWYVPTYFCSEVASAISACDIDVVRYEDSPLWARPRQPATQFESGDVFLLVNYFGFRGADAAANIDLGPAELVEDHTHDPWSDWALSSRATYCLASLRKTLPVPDGATLWSPCSLPLPTGPAESRDSELTVLLKTAAMCLKRLYLDGYPIEKDVYRQLQLEGEALFDRPTISGISSFSGSWLNVLPWQCWRDRRRENYLQFRELLSDLPGINVLSSWSESTCPFALVLYFEERTRRDHVRGELIANKIYPAVHWPIPLHSPPAMRDATDLAQSLLSIPCDFRYDSGDIQGVARAIRNAMRAPGSFESDHQEGATPSLP